jgi:hypothetical protein
MTPMSLSIVTVCMNRQQHLIETAARVAVWPYHSEHLILDWSSAVPLQRDELPDDDRLRLVRVDGERDWHLCRAYNLALQLACGDVLFKLDADCWPQPDLDPAALRRDGSLCSFGSGPDGRLGQWILDRSLLEGVGGFNEFLVGYGFDDKDLRARVMARCGGEGPPLQARQLGVIVHSALERIGAGPESRRLPFREATAQAQKRASAMANRVLAASCPWMAQRRGSRYRWNASSSSWLVDVESVLRAPIEVDDEVRRLRRTLFWGELMTLPAAVVRQLPERLLPADQRGRLPVGALHRVLWYVIRPFWAWPCWLLEQIQLLRGRRSGGDGSKERFRTAYRSGDVEEMLSLLGGMEPRQRQQLVDRLLFQRAHRPDDGGTQIALLEGLQQMSLLPEHQRAYALIALGWTHLRERSPDQAKRCIRPLEDDVQRLLADPETLRCGRRNRENRLKRLISCWNLLGHLHLQDENWSALLQLSGSSSDVLHRVDPNQLPGDVLLRVSSNWARTLLWQGPQQPQKLVDDLQRLLAIIESDRCAASRPEEDHRGFVRDWLRRMSTWWANPSEGVLSSEELASALTVSTLDLIAAAEQYWRQDAPTRP